MDSGTTLMFTRDGLGHAPDQLRQVLADRFLSLIVDAGTLPARILFYAEGVKLACEGSPVLGQLAAIEDRGVELVLCKTCLDYFGLASQVRVGVVGGMTDIIEAMRTADKVISL
jgi:sulfur relay (sulfurtransferase) complex TusBCD TusD component (DsrE family)